MNAVATIDRDDVLPVNIEAEQALLGAVLVNADCLPAVSWFLKPEHFSEPVHRAIYEVCLDMAAKGRRPTPISVKDFVPKDMVIGTMTLAEYLACLAASATTIINAEDYARAILDLWTRREEISVGLDLQEAARNLPVGITPKDHIEAAIQRLSELSAVGLRHTLRQSTAAAAADLIVADMDSAEPVDPPISTGLADLDRIIGGLRRGNLLILAGRPGMAKTMLAGAINLNVTRAGHGAVFFEKEMTKEGLTARLLTDLAHRDTLPVTYEMILNRQVIDEEHKFLIRDAAKRLRGLPLIIDPQPGLTMVEIAARARRAAESMARKNVRLGLITTDHLGKIRTARGGRDSNRNIDLGEITGAAAELSKELDCAFLMLCQLNRLVESRDDKHPQLSDLRESGRIEEDADVVLANYREAYYLAKQKYDDAAKEIARGDRLARVENDLDVLVLKNRHGAEGRARLWVHAGCAAVRNVDRWH